MIKRKIPRLPFGLRDTGFFHQIKNLGKIVTVMESKVMVIYFMAA